MSAKRQLLKYHLVSAGDMSSTITSSATNINYLDNIGIQANITGTPSGMLSVQISADYYQDAEGNVLTAGHWTTVTPLTQTITSGSPTPIYLDIQELSAPWIRVVYTASSGSGTLDVYITGKTI